MRLCLAMITGALLTMAATSAQAATIFDTGTIVSSVATLRILSPGGAYAVRFTVFQPYVLTRASTVGRATGTNPATLSFDITSSVDALPGAVLFGCTVDAMAVRAVYGCDLGQSIAAGDYFLTVRADEEIGVQTIGNFSTPILRRSTETAAFVNEPFAAQFTLLGDAAAVPEPATWAMMVTGFGLAGGLARRTRSRHARSG
jgi:hypothetical protein